MFKTMAFFSLVFVMLSVVSTLIIPHIALAQIENIRLKIDPFRMAGTEIIFNVPDSPELARFSTRPPWVHAQTKNYTVFINLNEIQPDDNCACFIYPFYVEQKSAGSEMTGEIQLARFNVQVRSFFKDFSGTVRFQVLEQGQTNGETGEIDHLPFYCYQTFGGFIEPREIQVEEPLDLFTKSTITLELKNTLTDLSLQILGSSFAEFDKPSYWQQINPLQSNPLQPNSIEPAPLFTLLSEGKPHLILPAKESRTVARLVVRPDPISILTKLPKVWFSGPDDNIHETIRVYLNVRSLKNGRERTETIQVKVQFHTFWGLFVAVGVGSLLGSLISISFLKKQRRLQVFVRAFIIGFMLEIVGLVLVKGGSRFVLFHLDLNPEQLFPAALIGFIVGLTSFKNISAVRHFLKTNIESSKDMQAKA